MDALRLELNYLLSQLHDYETASFVVNEVQLYEFQLPQRLALMEGIRDGEWLKARTALLNLPHSDHDEELLSAHIAKELIWSRGYSNESLQFVAANVSSPAALRDLGASLLTNGSSDVQTLRFEVASKILSDSKYSLKLQETLNAALQFRNIVEHGKLADVAEADVTSYVYSDLYLRVLHNSHHVAPMKRLETICSNVKVLNQFNSPEISVNLRHLLDQCLADNPLHTVLLLKNNVIFSHSVQSCIRWSPLANVKTPTDNMSQGRFDFVKEYNKRRGQLPKVPSVVELGCVLQIIEDPYAVTMPTSPTLSEELYQPERGFALKPWCRIEFSDPIWSLAAKDAGKSLVVGTLPGKIYILQKKKGTYKMVECLEGTQGAEEISFDRKTSNFLVSQGGATICVSSNGTKYEERRVKGSPSSTYGDICWCPSTPNLFFSVNDSDNHLRLCDFISRNVIKAWKLPYKPLSISSSEKDIIILTSKTTERPQHILTVNYETSQLIDTELPSFHHDGMFTTLRCSEWDPRTILLMGPPNCIFIVDKYGERRTRVIYGPKQKQCMLKARFAGPMDKFIITTSEDTAGPQAFVVNRFTGDKVASLNGHSKMVNDIAWSSANESSPQLFTGSDDNSVLVYGL